MKTTGTTFSWEITSLLLGMVFRTVMKKNGRGICWRGSIYVTRYFLRLVSGLQRPASQHHKAPHRHLTPEAKTSTHRKECEFCALVEKLMNSAEKAFRFKGAVYQCNYSPSVAFEAITLHTMPATHCRWDPSEDNDWLSGIIGPDATNKLKCVSLSSGTVPRTVTDVAINAWEQPLWRLKKVIILPCQWAALP